jgi:hypothetical protein
MHKGVLKKQSEYFKACLNGRFKETHEITNTFDDIDPEHLTMYLKACYIESFIREIDRPCEDRFRIEPTGEQSFYSIAKVVDLWRLCDRFIHGSLEAVVNLTMRRTIAAMGRLLKTASGPHGNSEDCPGHIRSFADSFRILLANTQTARNYYDPHKCLITMFCKCCSNAKWMRAAPELPIEFVTQVSIRCCKENDWRRICYANGTELEEEEDIVQE